MHTNNTSYISGYVPVYIYEYVHLYVYAYVCIYMYLYECTQHLQTKEAVVSYP